MIKAIETTYKGYRFRSRLEARWAVFFETLNFKWEYEPEGFDLGSGVKYLPDFRIRNAIATMWYEVKPTSIPESNKFFKFQEMVQKINRDKNGNVKNWSLPLHAAALLDGDPYSLLFGQLKICPVCGFISEQYAECDGPEDENYYGCGPCDWSWRDLGEHSIVDCEWHKGFWMMNNKKFTRYKMLVNMAAENARSARFEFGEEG